MDKSVGGSRFGNDLTADCRYSKVYGIKYELPVEIYSYPLESMSY